MMEGKKKSNINFKILIIIICLIVFLGGIIIVKHCLKNDKGDNPYINEIIPLRDNYGYNVYTYKNKEYYVLNNAYDGEYDIQSFTISSKESDKINEFSFYTYDEYESFCKKYSVNQKYKNKDKHYIMYYYTIFHAESINAKLGGVEYNDDKVKLYIWDKINYKGGVILEEADQGAYVIIIPTDKIVNEHEIIPLVHKVEYNRTVGNNPLDGYYFSKEDNKVIAVNNHINTKNSLLNNIINNSMDAIADKHTIKVDTYIDNTDINLVSYMDLINSVFKIQAGTKALRYRAYASDMMIYYDKNNNDNKFDASYSFYDVVVDRKQILYDVFSVFGNDFIENIDNYEINIKEENLDYIIDVKGSVENLNTIYYIKKDTYLIDKVINGNRTNEFSYIDDNILLPDDINEANTPILVDKPIIYLYPEEEINVEVKLKKDYLLTTTYPKYENSWRVLAKTNGDLVDLKTNRNLYALYYESNSVEKFSVSKEGFVVKGEDSYKFLEEKLAVLGLSEKESEEFIIYWLPKLESNKYNYIRFATQQEIDNNMPLEVNPNPDTIIRVLMIFKGLERPIKVDEQKLTTPSRNGFTLVEWGGTEIK